MKLKLLYSSFLMLCVASLVSCGGNDEIKKPIESKPFIDLSSKVLKTTGEYSTRKLKLSANRPWNVVLTEDQRQWIAVSPESGEGTGAKEEIVITLMRNMDINHRTADIPFVIDENHDVNVVFKVSQGTEYMFERDSLALVDFYNSTNGKNWTKPWDIEKPISYWGYYIENPTDGSKSWQGVGTDLDANNSRRVSSLWWTKDMNMSGVIPKSIGNLDFMAGICLAGFKSAEGFTFSDLITVFEPLPNLTRLWLYDGCTFNGSKIGNDLAKLKKLSSLNILDHDFVGFEDDFGTAQMPELLGFTVAEGKFEVQLDAKYFAGMSNILVISLYDNIISGEVPENFISGKKSLRGLELKGNCLTGVFPMSIRNSIVFSNSDGESMICPQNADCGGGFTSGCL